MAKNSYAKSKGRRAQGRFIALPLHCLEHENFIRLSAKGTKLFVDLCSQYNGFNNGDLSVAFSIMQKRGWKSKETLFLAKEELLHYGWITCTRAGMMPRVTNLYALTFYAIDECKGKLDVASTIAPPGDWKKTTDLWKLPETYQRRGKKARVRIPDLAGTNSVTKK